MNGVRSARRTAGAKTVLRRIAIIGALLAAGLPPGVAHATILWNEDVDGDLPSSNPPVFSLEDPENVVIGSSFWVYDDRDDDSFGFLVSPGSEVTEITFTTTSIDVADYYYTEWSLRDSDGIELDQTGDIIFYPSSSPTTRTIFTSVTPLGPGTYEIDATAAGRGQIGGGIDYEFSIVPEPGAAWLMLTVLGAWFGGSRRAVG